MYTGTKGITGVCVWGDHPCGAFMSDFCLKVAFFKARIDLLSVSAYTGSS